MVLVGGFPKLGASFFGVPLIRTIANWGPPILGNYHLGLGIRLDNHAL